VSVAPDPTAVRCFITRKTHAQHFIEPKTHVPQLAAPLRRVGAVWHTMSRHGWIRVREGTRMSKTNV